MRNNEKRIRLAKYAPLDTFFFFDSLRSCKAWKVRGIYLITHAMMHKDVVGEPDILM